MGDIVRIWEDEYVPADVLLLSASPLDSVMVDTSRENGQRGLQRKQSVGWNIKFESDADF